MTVIQQSSEVTDGQKQLRIVGEPAKVDYAEQLVNDMLTDKEPDAQNRFKVRQPNEYAPGMHTMELPVSPQYIGLVIGKGGENIKRIAAETGAKLQVDTTKSDHSGNKICQISSLNMASVNMAADMVKKILENAANGRPAGGNQYGHQDEVRIQVPPNKTGLVIGKGGETVKGLKQQAGCNIELDKNSKGVFVIRGAPERIHYAQQLISEKIQSPVTVISGSEGGQGAGQADAYSEQYWQSAAAQNPYAFAQDPSKALSDPNGTFFIHLFILSGMVVRAEVSCCQTISVSELSNINFCCSSLCCVGLQVFCDPFSTHWNRSIFFEASNRSISLDFIQFFWRKIFYNFSFIFHN